MGSLNKVMLIGRLGSDVEKKATQSGSSVANFNIATTNSYKDQQGNRQEKTEWTRIVLWNRLADLAEQYLSKGTQVYIEGSLRTNEWTDKDGNKRYTTEVTGNKLEFIDSKSSESNHSSNSQSSQQKNKFNQSQSNQVDDDFVEDTIPF